MNKISKIELSISIILIIVFGITFIFMKTSELRTEKKK